jgi:hypothetical protein
MKNSIELSGLIKKKDEIITDMKACITYVPEQENDLLCFMERYLKAETEERPRLLEQLRKCMDGDVYDNPFEAYYCYSVDDIERFNQILSSFLNQSKGISNKPVEFETTVQKLVDQLNHLNASCRNELIDTYRREKLISLLEEAGKLLKFEGIKVTVNEHRTW